MMTAQHAARLDDLENRIWSNNVRAIGIPERAKGKNPVAFIESSSTHNVWEGVVHSHVLSGEGPQSAHAPPTAGPPSSHLPV